MHLLCVGLSHQTAPVALREKVAFNDAAAEAALRDLQNLFPGAEIALLSTCNRTEFYIARPLHAHPRVEEIIGYVADARGVTMDQLAEVIVHNDNERTVRHLMRVAGGLESMVLGEYQILAQVKHAYDLAQRCGTVGKVLHKVFQSALATAKRVRNETRIGAGRTSVSSAAVDFARHLFHRFDDKTLLCIGAGKMTELTLQHFLELRPKGVMICNRSMDKARLLAEQYHGEAVEYAQLDDHLVAADLVITSTGSQEPIVTAAQFKGLLKRRRFRPLIIIDIAVPRDFEAEVGDLANVYLYNLDDLQRAIAEGMSQRSGEVAACELIIEQAVAECYDSVQSVDFADLIRQLRHQLQEIGEMEAGRTLNKLRTADPAEYERIVAEHTNRLINKILHRPLSELGRSGSTQAAMYATALRRVFELEGPSGEDLARPERRIETRTEQPK